MAGQDAFLTGSISRKLHLHARRLQDRPSRRRPDRRHRRAARPFRREPWPRWASIPRSATCRSTRSNISETPEGKRKAASAAAKARRKDRKGERRSAAGAADASRTAPSPGRIATRCSPSSPTSPSARSASTGRLVVHAPVVVAAPDRLRFHVSRGNRARRRSTAARAIVSCLGPDAYISPDWYGTPDQVPTWNYLAVEAEGPLRRLDEDELAALLDDLSAAHEARLAPKPPWTRAKMTPGPLRGDAEGDRRLRAARSRICAAPASSARTRTRPSGTAPPTAWRRSTPRSPR